MTVSARDWQNRLRRWSICTSFVGYFEHLFPFSPQGGTDVRQHFRDCAFREQSKVLTSFGSQLKNSRVDRVITFYVDYQASYYR